MADFRFTNPNPSHAVTVKAPLEDHDVVTRKKQKSRDDRMPFNANSLSTEWS